MSMFIVVLASYLGLSEEAVSTFSQLFHHGRLSFTSRSGVVYITNKKCWEHNIGRRKLRDLSPEELEKYLQGIERFWIFRRNWETHENVSPKSREELAVYITDFNKKNSPPGWKWAEIAKEVEETL